jgi:hypothetical protein
MEKGLMRVGYLLCVMAVFLMIGCAGGSKISIKQDNYSPDFRAGDYSRFKGKTVILDNFINQANNTKSWSYSSADNKYTYEASAHLESYLWYCFQKAFQHAGMKVMDQSYGGAPHPYHPYWWGAAPPPPRTQSAAPRGTSEFQLVLTSMTDQECKFQVLVFKNGETKLQKDYSVTMTPPTSADPKELEKRAYRLIDQMVTTVFKDSEFRRVF